MWDGPLYTRISMGHRLQFPNNVVFLSEDCFCPSKLANSADPDEMPHYVAFHLGLHCLPKY